MTSELGTPASASPAHTGLLRRAARITVGALTAALLGTGAAGMGAGTAAPAAAATSTCSSVTQHGVVFTFDKAYPCGKFANGDAWVTPTVAGGTVTVTSVTPRTSIGRHGLMKNPSSRSAHAYDSRVGGYDAALNLALPAKVGANSSLVKAVSSADGCGNGTGHPSCLKTATVLTVLGSVPANGGATVFRPPYFGTDKPLMSTTAIRTDLLPKLAPVSTMPTLAQVRDRFSRVQLDHKSTWQGRYLHPADNFLNLSGTEVSNYGSDLARDNNDAALRLMLNDPIADKMPALVNYLQAGIDWYGTSKGGVSYHSDGGHNVGRKVALTFAAVVLNNADMKAVAGRTESNAFSENGHIYRGGNGRPLFGKGCSDGMYDRVRLGGSGSRDCRDPLGLIDGGELPGRVYQKCCTAKAYMASSLATRLLPGGRSVWNADHFHEYVDRWMSFGTWSAPDPKSRFLSYHGTNAGSGTYGSSFQTAMWAAYKAYQPPVAAAPTTSPSAPAMTLRLINADTDREIRTLSSGGVIDFSDLGTRNLSVRAVVPTATESVRFSVDGVLVATENAAPYAIRGDRSGPDYLAWTPAVGVRTLTVKAYSANSGGGSVLVSRTLDLTVRN